MELSDRKEVACREILTKTFFPFLLIEIDNKMRYSLLMVLIGMQCRAGYALPCSTRYLDHRAEAYQGQEDQGLGQACKS